VTADRVERDTHGDQTVMEDRAATRQRQTDRRRTFEQLFNDNFTAVERYINHRFPDIDTADVVSTTFTTLWRKLDDCPQDAARGWLFGIARNTARNTSRARRRRAAAETTAPTHTKLAAELHDVSVPADTAARIVSALEQLNGTDREIVELAAFHGLTGCDLGAALGVSNNVANVRLHRARRRLAEAYAAQEPDR
jgi:RNA polymerase sigma-70 factor (ECF subfamily)